MRREPEGQCPALLSSDRRPQAPAPARHLRVEPDARSRARRDREARRHDRPRPRHSLSRRLFASTASAIYIDRHLPPTFQFRGREIAVDRYLLLHEEVEKTLIDQLKLHYQHAHQIATRAEEAAVRADGISWRAYDRFMQQFVKTVGDERLTKLPADSTSSPIATNTTTS